jgi:hypothetical protein
VDDADGRARAKIRNAETISGPADEHLIAIKQEHDQRRSGVSFKGGRAGCAHVAPHRRRRNAGNVKFAGLV